MPTDNATAIANAETTLARLREVLAARIAGKDSTLALYTVGDRDFRQVSIRDIQMAISKQERVVRGLKLRGRRVVIIQSTPF